MVSNRVFSIAIVACIVLLSLLFHTHQTVVAYSLLEGFWFIGTDDDGDYYMLIDNNQLQILATQGDANVVLFVEDICVSCRPTLSVGTFSFSMKLKDIAQIPILGIDANDKYRMRIYESCGMMDISSNDSMSRIVKDNAMTIAYNDM